MVSLSEQVRRPSSEVVVAAPISEAVAAIAVIVLSVLGLVKIRPDIMLGIVTIVVGAGMALQALERIAEYSQATLLSDTPSAVGADVTLKVFAGVIGIVLGVLALFSNVAQIAPAALIVFGGALLLGGGGPRSMIAATEALTPMDGLLRESARVVSGVQVMVGVAAIVLGILSYTGAAGIVLNLVGLMAIGGAFLLTGVTATGTIVGAQQR